MRWWWPLCLVLLLAARGGKGCSALQPPSRRFQLSTDDASTSDGPATNSTSHGAAAARRKLRTGKGGNSKDERADFAGGTAAEGESVYWKKFPLIVSVRLAYLPRQLASLQLLRLQIACPSVLLWPSSENALTNSRIGWGRRRRGLHWAVFHTRGLRRGQCASVLALAVLATL